MITMITNMLNPLYLQAYIGTMKVLLFRKCMIIMTVYMPMFWHIVSKYLLDGFIFADLVLGYKMLYKYY